MIDLGGPATREEKRERARQVLGALADRDVEEAVKALQRLIESFDSLDLRQLEDHISDEVWDGLMRAVAACHRRRRASPPER